MKKTLVIHPKDSTTTFLSKIYRGRGFTVITDIYDYSDKEIMEEVKKHDRIMIMGHGCPQGLLGRTKLFMNQKFIDILKQKFCICIWCNADKYVEREGLYGFYTGMIISEVNEALYYDIYVDQSTVDESNKLFTEAIKKSIYKKKDIVEEAKKIYVTTDNPVIQFNQQRLYYRDKTLIKYPKDVDYPTEICYNLD